MLSKKFLLPAALATLGCAPLSSMADTATATFDVLLTITATCDISAGAGSNINFGNHIRSETDLVADNNIYVTCSASTPYNIGLLPTNTGATANGTGNLTSAASSDQVPYALWQDDAHSVPWGNTVGTNTEAGTGTGDQQTVPVYATVASVNYTPGDYTDTVTVTVTY